MTIAAAFHFEGGILLCSDTELTVGDSLKDYQQKLYFERFRNASLGFAIVGSVDYAVMAVQQILHSIRKTAESFEEIRKIVSQTILEIYQSHIHSHPLASYNQAPYFELLVAVWTQATGLRLISTSETAVVESDRGYVCKGSGATLARFLVSKAQAASLRTPAALMLAQVVLNNVRTYVPGCGGHSQILVISPNGWISMAAPFFMRTYESVVEDLEKRFTRMLLTTGDLAIDDGKFEEQLNRFCERAREARRDARKSGLDNLDQYLVPMGEYSF